MGKISITMPDAMSDYVERRVEEGRYDDASAFFRDLVERDREGRRLTVEELRARLERAQASGLSERTVPEIMGEARRRAREQELLS